MNEDLDCKRLAADYDVLAPDGSEIRLLAQTGRGSMVHCTLPPGQVSVAVAHRTVEEVWYCLEGAGQVWRRLEGAGNVRQPLDGTGQDYQRPEGAGQNRRQLDGTGRERQRLEGTGQDYQRPEGAGQDRRGQDGASRDRHPLDGAERIVDVAPGVSLSIPVGSRFQFRNTGTRPLRFIIVTMPPWPGEQEAYPVPGRWPTED